MKEEQFISSLHEDTPPATVSACLKALWYDKKENWDMAHSIAQDIRDDNGSWVHAYLHRKEGDSSNAGYWYRIAGKPMPSYSLEKEWEEMVKALLKSEI